MPKSLSQLVLIAATAAAPALTSLDAAAETFRQNLPKDNKPVATVVGDKVEFAPDAITVNYKFDDKNGTIFVLQSTFGHVSASKAQACTEIKIMGNALTNPQSAPFARGFIKQLAREELELALAERQPIIDFKPGDKPLTAGDVRTVFRSAATEETTTRYEAMLRAASASCGKHESPPSTRGLKLV